MTESESRPGDERHFGSVEDWIYQMMANYHQLASDNKPWAKIKADEMGAVVEVIRGDGWRSNGGGFVSDFVTGEMKQAIEKADRDGDNERVAYHRRTLEMLEANIADADNKIPMVNMSGDGK